MKLRYALAGIVLVSGAGLAAAQTVVVNPDQEVVIREYVDRQTTASIDLPGVSLSVGATLPDTVEVHRIDVPDVKYSYVVVSGKTYVVEPDTRRVVHILN
jgi:hypothetical protein